MSGLVKGFSFLNKVLDLFPTSKEKVVRVYMDKRTDIQKRMERRKALSEKIKSLAVTSPTSTLPEAPEKLSGSDGKEVQ